MTRVISRSRLILLFSYVMLIAHTFAETPEGLLKEFTLLRQRHREGRRLTGTSPNVLSGPIKGLHWSDGPKESSQLSDVWAGAQSDNWSGALRQSPPSGTFNEVGAQWTLPQVSPPVSGAGKWFVGIWVGFDGIDCPGGILQAGSLSFVQVDNTGAAMTGAFLWVEWFPDPIIQFTSVPVAPGDVVKVSITAESLSQGTATAENLSKGPSASVPVSSPGPSQNICGLAIEWILEDPAIVNGYLPFAQFNPVTMSNCAGSTTTGVPVDLTGSQLIQMVQEKAVLATPSMASATQLEFING